MGDQKPKVEFTELEKKVLNDICLGNSYQAIADELSISRDEVSKLIRNIYDKIRENNSGDTGKSPGKKDKI